jgi:diguanylate cyclase (GGDEF)-like protein
MLLVGTTTAQRKIKMASEREAGDISRVPGRDSLTGSLRRAIAAAHSANWPVTLCLLDLDHFKSVNDAFGHARGDAVLAEFITRLRGAARGRGLLFRYGAMSSCCCCRARMRRQEARSPNGW